MAFKPAAGARKRPNQVTGQTPLGEVSVAKRAAAGVRRGRIGELAPTATLIDQLRGLKNDEIRAAYRAAFGRDISDRQIRRYRSGETTPHKSVVDLVGRRWEIKQAGGVNAAATKFGRAPSTIRDWQSGRTKHLKKDAAQRAHEAELDRRMKASGIDPSRPPKISFTADVHGRTEGKDYDFRTKKQFWYGPGGKDREPMDEDTVRALAHASLDGDAVTMNAILEKHASEHYALFDDYDNKTGMHFDRLNGLKVEWDKDDDGKDQGTTAPRAGGTDGTNRRKKRLRKK